MKISETSEKLDKIKTDALAFFLFEGEKPTSGEVKKLDKALSGSVSETIKLGDFKGKLYEVTPIYTHGKAAATRVFLVGLGKKKDFNPSYARNAAGAAARRAMK